MKRLKQNYMKPFFTFLALIIIYLKNIPTVFSQVNIQDSLALVDLYNTTKGVNWHHKGGWLTNKPVSTWYGITATASRVTGIGLEFNHLQNKIPPSLGNLTELQSLS